MTKRAKWRWRGQAYGLLIAIALLAALPEASAADKRVKYGKSVSLGLHRVRLDDICVMLGGYLSAGDFFRGLVRLETVSGPEFRKGSTTLTNYPDEITVRIEAFAGECSPMPGRLSPTGLAAEFMKSLRFALKWERESKLRPLEGFRAELLSPLKGSLINSWTYRITIPAKSTPLTDHLIISVLSKDGAKIALFSARL